MDFQEFFDVAGGRNWITRHEAASGGNSAKADRFAAAHHDFAGIGFVRVEGKVIPLWNVFNDIVDAGPERVQVLLHNRFAFTQPLLLDEGIKVFCRQAK